MSIACSSLDTSVVSALEVIVTAGSFAFVAFAVVAAAVVAVVVVIVVVIVDTVDQFD